MNYCSAWLLSCVYSSEQIYVRNADMNLTHLQPSWTYQCGLYHYSAAVVFNRMYLGYCVAATAVRSANHTAVTFCAAQLCKWCVQNLCEISCSEKLKIQYVICTLSFVFANVEFLSGVRNVFLSLILNPFENKTGTNRIGVFVFWPSVFWEAEGFRE